MRQDARYTRGSCGSAALPASGWHTADNPQGTSAGYPGPDAKIELAGLHPGGMTQEAEPEIFRFLHAKSPEPVIGYGGVKGIFAYYKAVHDFGF